MDAVMTFKVSGEESTSDRDKVANELLSGEVEDARDEVEVVADEALLDSDSSRDTVGAEDASPLSLSSLMLRELSFKSETGWRAKEE